jgi:hypothetical protein
MKRISFDKRFINSAGDNLVGGKLHTIRQNYDYWKRFEGREVALFTWEGKPYQKGSKQKVFCVKRIVSVQEIILYENVSFYLSTKDMANNKQIDFSFLAMNDGFHYRCDFVRWFEKYPNGRMAIIHFTELRY